MVILGPNLDYANAQAWSPINGIVVTSAAHAMAFENLKKFDDAYMRAEPTGIASPNLLQVLLICVAQGLFLVVAIADPRTRLRYIAGIWIVASSFCVSVIATLYVAMHLSPYWTWSVCMTVLGTAVYLSQKVLATRTERDERTAP